MCSLYPYVLKTGAFPIGYHNIYIGQDCTKLIGAARIIILVLGRRTRSLQGTPSARSLSPGISISRARQTVLRVVPKLLRNVHAGCVHSRWSADREFKGIWISYELRKAIEKDYLVTSVSEIWQYEFARYNPDTWQSGLFAEYINTFLQFVTVRLSRDGRTGRSAESARRLPSSGE